jgi:hypothetical protein
MSRRTPRAVYATREGGVQEDIEEAVVVSLAPSGGIHGIIWIQDTGYRLRVC